MAPGTKRRAKLFEHFALVTRTASENMMDASGLKFFFPRDKEPNSLSFMVFPDEYNPKTLKRSPSESKLKEILYGQSYLRRGVDSYIYVVTEEDGRHLYGCCVRRDFVELRPGTEEYETTQLCFCIISRHPYFPMHFAILDRILTEDHSRRVAAFSEDFADVKFPDLTWTEDILRKFLSQAIPPSISNLNSLLQAPGTKPVDLTLIKMGFEQREHVLLWNLPVACRVVSLSTLMNTFAWLLLEPRLVINSSQMALLSSVSLSLVSLLQPLKWVANFTPILNSKIKQDVLEAPTPFIFGIHGEVPTVDFTPMILNISSDSLFSPEGPLPAFSHLQALEEGVRPFYEIMRNSSANRRSIYEISVDDAEAAMHMHDLTRAVVTSIVKQAVPFFREHPNGEGLRVDDTFFEIWDEEDFEFISKLVGTQQFMSYAQEILDEKNGIKEMEIVEKDESMEFIEPDVRAASPMKEAEEQGEESDESQEWDFLKSKSREKLAPPTAEKEDEPISPGARTVVGKLPPVAAELSSDSSFDDSFYNSVRSPTATPSRKATSAPAPAPAPTPPPERSPVPVETSPRSNATQYIAPRPVYQDSDSSDDSSPRGRTKFPERTVINPKRQTETEFENNKFQSGSTSESGDSNQHAAAAGLNRRGVETEQQIQMQQQQQKQPDVSDVKIRATHVTPRSIPTEPSPSASLREMHFSGISATQNTPTKRVRQCGIGAKFGEDKSGGYFIKQLKEGGSAIATGQLKVYDIVHSVNGIVARGLSVDEFTKLVLGMPGTVLKLTINRNSQLLTFAITRQPCSQLSDPKKFPTAAPTPFPAPAGSLPRAEIKSNVEIRPTTVSPAYRPPQQPQPTQFSYPATGPLPTASGPLPKQFQTSYDPKSFDPKVSETKSYVPRSFDPKSYDPNPKVPERFDPKNFDPKSGSIKRGTYSAADHHQSMTGPRIGRYGIHRGGVGPTENKNEKSLNDATAQLSFARQKLDDWVLRHEGASPTSPSSSPASRLDVPSSSILKYQQIEGQKASERLTELKKLCAELEQTCSRAQDKISQNSPRSRTGRTFLGESDESGDDLEGDEKGRRIPNGYGGRAAGELERSTRTNFSTSQYVSDSSRLPPSVGGASALAYNLKNDFNYSPAGAPSTSRYISYEGPTDPVYTPPRTYTSTAVPSSSSENYRLAQRDLAGSSTTTLEYLPRTGGYQPRRGDYMPT